MLKIFACVLVFCGVSLSAKTTDTLITVTCKCDTLRVLRTVDTTVTVSTKLDTLNVKHKTKK